MPITEALRRRRAPGAGRAGLGSRGLLLWVVCGAAGWAQETPPTPWKTGAELERQLTDRLGLTWAANPLRAALDNLARSQRVAIFLDRRVDPDQELTFAIQDTPLRTLLQQLAAHLQLGSCRVGPVVYLGPRSTAAVLGTVAGQLQERTQKLPSAVRSKLMRTRPVRWAALATPRELIQTLAEEADLRVVGLEQIPHDLWRATELPPLDFAQHLSLLLAGFELTFDYAEARTIRLLPLPIDAVQERTYALSAHQRTALAEVLQRFPDARLTSRGSSVVVVGPPEVQQAVQELLQPSRPPSGKPAQPSRKSETTWSLTVKDGPVGAVAKTVARRLERQLEYDPSLRPRLEQLVSFEVREATLDELLQRALSPAGLTYRLEENVLRILPAEPGP